MGKAIFFFYHHVSSRNKDSTKPCPAYVPARSRMMQRAGQHELKVRPTGISISAGEETRQHRGLQEGASTEGRKEGGFPSEHEC